MSELEEIVSPIEKYLVELTRELGAGEEFTPRFVNEARDHLLSSANRHEQSGLTRAKAEEAAIKSFGSAEEIVSALRNGEFEKDAIGSVRAISAGEGSMMEMEVAGVRSIRTSELGEEEKASAIGQMALELSKRNEEAWKRLDPTFSEGADPGDLVFLLLQEKEGDRHLPIFIGKIEATAIALALAGTETARPMTHDFLVSVLQALDEVEASRVVISSLAKGTYYAHLDLRQSGKDVHVDARPSDAIAVAVRLGLPVFVNEEDEELAGALVSVAA